MYLKCFSIYDIQHIKKHFMFSTLVRILYSYETRVSSVKNHVLGYEKTK